MIAGALEIQLMADMSRLTADMQAAQQLTGAAMGNISTSINQAKATIDAMAAAEKARASLFDRTMTETKRLLEVVKGGATETGKALADLKVNPDAMKVPQEVFDSLKSWKDQVAFAVGAGGAIAVDKAKTLWEDLKGYTEKTLIIWGVAVATGIAAVVLSTVYAAYKSVSFVVGLFTGESYKSASIDVLVKQTDELKASQDALASTLANSGEAIRANKDVMTALGVAYQDDNGKILTTVETLQNAVDTLDMYTEGSARAAAAVALGLGSYDELTKALKKVDDQTAESRQRLNDYNLGIGTESAAAVAAYKAAMKDFNDELQKTSDGFKRAWADQIMPVLTDLAVFLKDGFPAAVDLFRVGMATITSLFYGLKTVVFIVAESVVGSISAMASAIAGVATAAAKALTGDFAGAKEALVTGWENTNTRIGDIGNNIVEQSRHNGDAMRLAFAGDNRADGLPLKAITEGLSGATAQALKLADSYTSNRTALSALQQDFIKLNAAMDDMAAHGQKGTAQYDALEVALMKVGKQIGDVAANVKEEALATDPQIKAYADLIAKINEKIDANNLEATVGRKLTEAETQALEIRKMAEKGTISLTQAEAALTKEKIKALDVAEIAKLVQQSEFKQAQEIALVRQKLNQDGYDQAKILYETEVTINRDRMKSGKETLEQLQFDTQALTMNTAERDLAIAMRSLEKSGIKEGTDAWTTYGEAIKVAVGQRSEVQKGINDFKQLWDSIDKTAQTTFTNIFQGGQNAFTKLRDTLKATLLDLLYQMTVRKWVFDITASVSGATGGAVSAVAQGATSGLGGAFNMASSAFGAATNATALGVYGGMGELSSLGFTEAISSGFTALTSGVTGSVAAGLGTLAGVLGPIGLGIGLLTSLMGNKLSASTSTGSMERVYDASGNITSSKSPFAVGNGAEVVDSIFKQFKGLQDALGATGGAGFGYGSYSGTGNKNPMFRTTGGSYNSGETSLTGANVDLAANRAILSALQNSDMPKSLAKILNSVTVDTASLAQIQAVETAAVNFANGIKAMSAAMDNMPFAQLRNMAFDTAAALVSASGGLQNLSTNLASYHQNFYNAEEQRTQKVSEITLALKNSGLNVTDDQIRKMADDSENGRAKFRAMVEGLGAATEANAPMLAALYAVSGAFAAITPASTAASSAIAAISQTMLNLQANTANLGVSLLRAQGNTAGADWTQRTIDTTGYTAAEAAIYDYNKALQAQIDALTAATAKAAQVAQERTGLMTQYTTLTDTAAQALKRQRDALDESNKGLFDSVQAIKEKQAAEAAATAKATAIAQERTSLQNQLNTLTDTAVQALARQRSALDETNRALFDQIQAEKALQAAAIQAAADAAKALADAKTAGSNALQILSNSINEAKNVSKAAFDAQIVIINAQKSAATEAFNAQKVAINASIQASQATATKLAALSSSLQSTIDGMQVSGTVGIERIAGQQQINAALATARSTGVLPDAESLKQALAAVSKPSDQLFGTFVDYQRDLLLTKNSLNDLNGLTKFQKTAAEQTVTLLQTMLTSGQTQFDDLIKSYDKAAKDAQDQYNAEIARYDATFKLAQDQLAAALGTKLAVMSVAEAIASLKAAIGQIKAVDNHITGIDILERNGTPGDSAFPDTLSKPFSPSTYSSAPQNTASLENLQAAISDLTSQVAQLTVATAKPVTFAADTSVPMVVQIINKQGVLQ
jgi:hypothetical protein